MRSTQKFPKRVGAVRISLIATIVTCCALLTQTPALSEGENDGSRPSDNGPAGPPPDGGPLPQAEAPPAWNQSPTSTEQSAPPAPPPFKDGNAGMYQEKFKCSDGYDPDKDPALHPPNQDSKVRMLVNAQAQKEHEDQLQARQAAGAEPATKLDGGERSPEADQKPGNPPTKETTAEKNKEKDKEKDGKNPDGKQSDRAAATSTVMNPVQEALFLIQARKFHDSLSVLGPLVSRNGNNLDARYLMAISYVGIRKYAEAAEQYKKIIEMAPHSKQAALSVEGLKKIRQ